MRSLTCVVLLFTVFSLVAISVAQQTSTTAVPNLVNYSGTLVVSSDLGVPAKTVGVTFAIYRQQDGGAPLWLETHESDPELKDVKWPARLIRDNLRKVLRSVTGWNRTTRSRVGRRICCRAKLHHEKSGGSDLS